MHKPTNASCVADNGKAWLKAFDNIAWGNAPRYWAKQHLPEGLSQFAQHAGGWRSPFGHILCESLSGKPSGKRIRGALPHAIVRKPFRQTVRAAEHMPEGLLHHSVGQRPTFRDGNGLPEGLSQHRASCFMPFCERLSAKPCGTRRRGAVPHAIL